MKIVYKKGRNTILSGMGIDGTSAGWLASGFNANGTLNLIAFSKTLLELLEALSARQILIDMPIGLPFERVPMRECDSLVRRELTGRASCVFSPPTRSALRMSDYQSACRENLRSVGKKISMQSWNLKKKILEVDSLLEHFDLQESHPELCFQLFGDKQALPPKKLKKGKQQRMDILQQFIPDISQLYPMIRQALLVREAADDDILDSLILALSAHGAAKKPGGIRRFPLQAVFDRRRRKMHIIAWQPL